MPVRLSPVLRRQGWALAVALLAGAGPAQAAVNSYRFLHVTINTPWHIFLFLLVGIFSPFVLMVVLMWRYSLRRPPAGGRPAGPPAPPSPPN